MFWKVMLLCACLASAALNWTHTIVGSVYLSQYATDWRGECSHVWIYDLVAVLYTGLVGLFFMLMGLGRTDMHLDAAMRKNCSGSGALAGALALTLFIWGAVILANIDAGCRARYQADDGGAPQLWTLFLVSFSYAVVNVAIVCCCIPAVAAASSNAAAARTDTITLAAV